MRPVTYADGGKFFMVSHAVLDELYEEGLTPLDQAVYFCLLRHANFKDGACWPTIERLAELTGMGRTSVKRSLAALEANGHITIERRIDHERGGKMTNLYTITERLATIPKNPVPVPSGPSPYERQSPDDHCDGPTRWSPDDHKQYVLEQDEEEQEEICASTAKRAPAPTVSEEPSDDAPLPKEFCEFWDYYPKKRGKRAALRAWKATAKSRPKLDALLAAIDAARRSPEWTKDGGDFIPYPATWLNAGRWDDDYGPAKMAARPAPGSLEELVEHERKLKDLRLWPESWHKKYRDPIQLDLAKRRIAAMIEAKRKET